MNPRLVQSLGAFLAILAGAGLLPLLYAIAIGASDARNAFALAVALWGLAAVLAFVMTRLGSPGGGLGGGPGGGLGGGLGGKRAMTGAQTHSEAAAIAVGFWLLTPLAAAAPAAFLGAETDFTQAWFDAASDLTATGSLTLAQAQAESTASAPFWLWRLTLTWLGGLACVVMVLSVFARLGFGGLHTMATGLAHPGPDAPWHGRFTPALRLWVPVYGLATCVAFVAFLLVGEAPRAAMEYAVHGLAASSVRLDGAPNLGRDIILGLCLVFAASNVALWRARHAFTNDKELWLFGALVVVGTGILWLGGAGNSLMLSLCLAAGAGCHQAVLPNPGVATALFLLPLIAGASFSTAGGMKASRVLLLARRAFDDAARSLFPHGVRSQARQGAPIDLAAMTSVWVLVACFAITLALAVIGLSLAGLELEGALAAALAAMTNTGPLFEVLAPDAAIPDAARGVLAATMTAARCEFVLALMHLAAAWER